MYLNSGPTKDRALLRVHASHTPVQWSLYFKTTDGTKKMWSYIVGGLQIKVI